MTTEQLTGTGTAASDFTRPFKFQGSHFKRWQQKMLFFLTTKKVANVLNKDMPVIIASSIPSGSNNNGNTLMDTNVFDPGEKAKQDEKDIAVNKTRIALALCRENDYLCKNYILNGLTDEMYDYYSRYENAKQVWDTLEKKYDTEKDGVKKYEVSLYLKFQMTDDKLVDAQSHELQRIAHEIVS